MMDYTSVTPQLHLSYTEISDIAAAAELHGEGAATVDCLR